MGTLSLSYHQLQLSGLMSCFHQLQYVASTPNANESMGISVCLFECMHRGGFDEEKKREKDIEKKRESFLLFLPTDLMRVSSPYVQTYLNKCLQRNQYKSGARENMANGISFGGLAVNDLS